MMCIPSLQQSRKGSAKKWIEVTAWQASFNEAMEMLAIGVKYQWKTPKTASFYIMI